MGFKKKKKFCCAFASPAILPWWIFPSLLLKDVLFFVGEGHIQGWLIEHSPDDQFCFQWNEEKFGNRWQVMSFFIKKFH